MQSTSVPDAEHQIAPALNAIVGRIASAARACGRSPQDVTLVAVSKTNPAAAVLAALAGGQTCFGENRVQEASMKFAPLRAGHPALQLHLIGGLQTNKAEDAVRTADVIESLDRPRLADAIATAVQRTGRQPTLLIQVNIGDEPQKSGVQTGDADAFVDSCQRRFGGALRGLMCIPPEGIDPSPYFARLAAMRTRHGLAWLSMGMSGDFETAIRLGATHVRIGSAIFGQRAAPAPASAALQQGGLQSPQQPL